MKYVKSISLFFIYPACCFILGVLCGRIVNVADEQPPVIVESESSVFTEELSMKPDKEELPQGQYVMNHDALRESQAAEIPSINTGFYITITNGSLIVYEEDRETVFLITDIPGTDLPDEVVKELNDWIYMEDEGMLYDFLENYTS